MCLQVIHLLHRSFNRVSAPFTKNVKPLPRSIFALLTTLVIVPCLLSYYNVRGTAQNYDVCFVGPSSSYENAATSAKYQDLYGTYRKIDEGGHRYAKTPFELSYFCLAKNFMPGRFCGWPSVTTLAHELSPTAMVRWDTAKRKTESRSESEDEDSEDVDYSLNTNQASTLIELDKENKIWCIHKKGLPLAEKSKETRVCSKTARTQKVNVAKGSYFEDFYKGPTNGLWDGVADIGGLQVHCYLSGNAQNGPEEERLVRKDGYINTSIEPLRLPATLFLIILQTWLYYRYRHLSTQPESVRLQYDRVFSPHNEWWRVATSAFAHFDKRHLIWDAYNLYSMGAALEQRYGAIMFLSLNMALVILTSLLTLGVTYIQIKIFRREISNRATHVGYSGVLFAWMVLASMEMGGIYPIPFSGAFFLENFESIPFWKGVQEMPINAAILANLVLAKVFIRKASIVSHGVGLIMGWFLYWNIPPRELLMPHVLIPTVLFLQLRFVQKLIPMTRRQGSGNNGSDPAATNTNSITPSTTATEDIQIGTPNLSNKNFIMRMLHILRGAMAISSVVSIIVLDNGMSASQCIVSLLFHYAVQSFPENDSTENTKATDAIMRSYFCSVVILIIVDATTMGAWIVAHVLILGHTLFESSAVSIFLAIRLLINLVGMVISAGILGHGDETVNMYGGIFLSATVAGEKIVGTKGGRAVDTATDNEMSSASAVRPEQIMV